MTQPQRLCDELPWEMLTRKEKWSMCDICDARWKCKDTASVAEILKDVPIPDSDPRRETHCRWGHPYTPDNSLYYKNPNGETRRRCRFCVNEQNRKSWRKKQEKKAREMGKRESSDLDIRVYSPRKSFVVAILWDGTYKGFEALQRVVKGLKGDIYYTGPKPKNYSPEGLPVPALPQRLSIEVNGSYAGILPGQFVILRHKYGPIVLGKEEFERLYEPVLHKNAFPEFLYEDEVHRVLLETNTSDIYLGEPE